MNDAPLPESWDPFGSAFGQSALPEAAASAAAPLGVPLNRPRILLADSESAFRKATQDLLEGNGYDVRAAADGNDALAQIKADPPDIAILDAQMAGKGGLEVAHLLRRNPLFASLPVIVLTRNPDRTERLKSLAVDVDDYLPKVGALDEILARMAMIIRRNKAILDSNALTHLPGNRTIQEKINEAVAANRPLAVMYFDLNNFKAYNDNYGFEGGDRVIRALAEILADLVQEPGGEADFLGHIGGDDFIYVTGPDRAEVLAPRICQRFEAAAPLFYNDQDRARGHITAEDRQGVLRQFSFVGVAIGIVHNRHFRIESFGQVAQIGAELKHAAKQNERSSWIMDRRKTYPSPIAPPGAAPGAAA